MFFATPFLLLTLLHYYSRLGTVRRLRFGFNEAKGTSKKLKQFSHQKIEVPGKRQAVTFPLDVESIEKDARIAKGECSGQVVKFGNRLQQYLFERSSVVETAEKDSEKGEETVLQMKDCMENAAQRRSRKGTPCRRARDNFIREKKENDEWSVTNGLVGKRSSPGNEGHDNCLNKRPAEHTKTDGMCSEPEGGFHIRQGGGQIGHGTLEKDSDCEDITDDESQEDLTIPPPSRERTCQNGNCIQFAAGTRKSLDKSNAMRPRCISQFHSLADLERKTTSERKHSLDDSKLVDRISRKYQFHGQELTPFNNGDNENNASYHAEKGAPSSGHRQDMTASRAVQSNFLKEKYLADRLGKGIPLYMPGQHKWINPDGGLQFYKHPSLVGYLIVDFELKLLKLKRSCNFSGTNPKRLFCDINVFFSLDHLCRSKWKFGKLTCFSIMAKRQ